MELRTEAHLPGVIFSVLRINVTDIAKLKAVTKSKLLSLENKLNFYISDICTFIHVFCTPTKIFRL